MRTAAKPAPRGSPQQSGSRLRTRDDRAQPLTRTPPRRPPTSWPPTLRLRSAAPRAEQPTVPPNGTAHALERDQCWQPRRGPRRRSLRHRRSCSSHMRSPLGPNCESSPPRATASVPRRPRAPHAPWATAAQRSHGKLWQTCKLRGRRKSFPDTPCPPPCNARGYTPPCPPRRCATATSSPNP